MFLVLFQVLQLITLVVAVVQTIVPLEAKAELVVLAVVVMATMEWLGELLERIERLRKLLDAEGLFDPRLKRELPFLPNLVGLNNTGLGTANSYYLRGVGNTESIATFDPPIGTYIDDIYINHSSLIS